MPARTFIDTNIFVYHLNAADPRKHALADHVVRDALQQWDACVGYRAVQEFLNVVCSKARVRLTPQQAKDYLEAVLEPLMQLSASIELYRRALDVQQRWRFGFYDALIVAAALSLGCKRLLSEDLQHGQRIETPTVVDPFRM